MGIVPPATCAGTGGEARRRGAGPSALDDQTRQALRSYAWPGNIRELENLIERSVLLSEGAVLTLNDLPGLTPTHLETINVPDAEEMGLKEYVRVYTSKLERARIQRVLEEEDCNVTRASKKLGISRKSLQMKMKDYGLRDNDKGTDDESSE